MTAFSADWLALREPADRSARSSRLTASIADALAGADAVRAVDLATGTGANVRYLAEHLPARQDWLLVDHDPVLLARVPERMRAWAEPRGYRAKVETHSLVLEGERLTCRFQTRCMNLAAIDDAALFSGRTLVTASALLDLVSEQWLRTLAARCRENGSSVLFALIYDGRIRCTPEEPEDEIIQDLVNRHQHTHKGFGLAVGPDAARQAEQCLASVGYQVRCEPSDWLLSAGSGDLQQQLIDGWARAAVDIAPDRAASIQSWQSRRLAHVAMDQSQLVVGHQDLAAWLP